MSEAILVRNNICEIDKNYIMDKIIHNSSTNLFKNTATTQTVNGVTFTVNNDGSIHCCGTATDDIKYIINDSLISLNLTDNLQYILYHVDENIFSVNKNYYLNVIGTSGKNSIIIGGTNSSYSIFNTSKFSEYSDYTFKAYICINNGTTINELILPKLCIAAEMDFIYEPRYESLQSLLDRIIIIENDIKSIKESLEI